MAVIIQMPTPNRYGDSSTRSAPPTTNGQHDSSEHPNAELPKATIQPFSEPKRAVIYTRVDRNGRAAPGLARSGQEWELDIYGRLRGITVLRRFHDNVDGDTLNRPALRRMARFVEEHAHDMDMVLFVCWNRLSWNADHAAELASRWAALGIEAHAMEQPLNPSIASHRRTLESYLLAYNLPPEPAE